MESLSRFFSENFNTKLININLSASSWKAIAIVVLVFFLTLTMAQVRRHYIHGSLKGGLFGIFFGFLLALFLEGFLIVGGRTALTEFLGWQNAPKPLQVALDSGRNKLVEVLGITDEIPQSNAANNSTSDDVVTLLQSLNPTEAKKAKFLICEP